MKTKKKPHKDMSAAVAVSPKKPLLILTKPKKTGGSTKEKLVIDGLEDQAASLREKSKEIDALSAEYDILKTEILGVCANKRLAAELDGDFHKTLAVESSDGHPLLVLFQDKYSKVAVEHEKALVKALGDHFESLFRKSCEIKPRGDLTKKGLRNLLGDKYDAFIAAVDVTEFLALESSFMEKRAAMRRSLDADTNEAIDQIVGQVQHKPAVKVG
jgi:hypothetical protein